MTIANMNADYEQRKADYKKSIEEINTWFMEESPSLFKNASSESIEVADMLLEESSNMRDNTVL